MGVSRKDFLIASSKAVDIDLQVGEWPVYRSYEFKGVGEKAYVDAPRWWAEEPKDPEELESYRQYEDSLVKKYKGNIEFASYSAAYSFGIEQHNKEERYRPLDYPDIFLRFARLVEESSITQEAVLDWVKQYGVLGVDKASGGMGFGNHRGGPSETVSKFEDCAREANTVLRLYEAASAPEGPDVEYLRACIVEPGSSPEMLSELARDYVRQTVHLRVAGECYPHLYRQRDGSFKQGWGFKSLLGAMWLQMMWLVTTAEEDIRCCLWCRRPIDFKRPEQPKEDPGLTKNARGKYRTREDKRFCGGRCRADWNYHYGGGKSSKHARKIERERRKVR
jgi:hypothetical protein